MTDYTLEEKLIQLRDWKPGEPPPAFFVRPFGAWWEDLSELSRDVLAELAKNKIELPMTYDDKAINFNDLWSRSMMKDDYPPR